jgi:predicted ATPase
LIDRLAVLGHAIVPEASRPYIEAELAKGRTLEEIRADNAAYQRKIAEIRIQNEAAADTKRLTFIDRGLPDSIVYHKLNNLDAGWVVEACSRYRYAGVFFLERLNLENDAVRWEDEQLAEKMARETIAAYAQLGYEIIHVPVLPVVERLEFILAKIPNY